MSRRWQERNFCNSLQKKIELNQSSIKDKDSKRSRPNADKGLKKSDRDSVICFRISISVTNKLRLKERKQYNNSLKNMKEQNMQLSKNRNRINKGKSNYYNNRNSFFYRGKKCLNLQTLNKQINTKNGISIRSNNSLTKDVSLRINNGRKYSKKMLNFLSFGKARHITSHYKNDYKK